MLVNTAYAFLAGECDALDRSETAGIIARGVDMTDMDLAPRRTALDDWLAEPMGRDAEAEQALLTYLKGA